MKYRITFLSDLHNRHMHWELKMKEHNALDEVYKSDVIVFCGDMSSRGTKEEVETFMNWFNEFAPGIKKIFIAGNHDFFFDYKWKPRTEDGFYRHKRTSTKEDVEEMLLKYSKLEYLCDSGTEYRGLKFWGTPVSPWFHDWAFNRWEDEIGKHWDLIPEDTDVLITHTPPYMKLDKIDPRFRRYNKLDNVGCPILMAKVSDTKPLIHAFGHIHEGYGMIPTFSGFEDDIVYINASNLNDKYEPVNPPVIFDFEK